MEVTMPIRLQRIQHIGSPLSLRKGAPRPGVQVVQVVHAFRLLFFSHRVSSLPRKTLVELRDVKLGGR